MRFTGRVYQSLVLFNTFAIFLIALAGVFICVMKRDSLGRGLDALFDREVASSKFLATTNLGAGDGPRVEYPVYDIKIKPANLRQIQIQVQQLTEAGIMGNDMKVWFPARFYHGSEGYKVKIRLKGDMPEHWTAAKKSWRVRFDKDKLFQGRRSVDLIIPEDKRYEVEPVSYEVARELGLLVPDSGFCRVRINGVDFGMYLWIEKYGKEMLEKQGYAVGEIFRQRNIWYRDYLTGFGLNPTYYTSSFSHTLQEGPGVGYYARRWDHFVTLIREADDATFRREIPHLIGVEQYLTWNALTWLFGSTHACWGDNQRWFYDNTSGLFEPILYDINRYPILLPNTTTGRRQWKFDLVAGDMLSRRIMEVPEHRQRRNEILWRLLNDDRFDLARRCDEAFQPLRLALLSGVGAPSARIVDERHAETIQILEANRKHLRELLASIGLFVTPVLTLNEGTPTIQLRLLPDSRNQIRVERLNLVFSEAVAERVVQGGIRAVLTDLNGSEHAVEDLKVTMPNAKAVAVEFKDLSIWTPVNQKLHRVAAEWLLRLELPGIESARWKKPGFLLDIEPHCRNSVSLEPPPEHETMTFASIYRFDGERPSPVTRPVDDFIADSGLPFRKDGKFLVLPKGKHLVEHDLTVPAEYALRFEAGAVLRIARGVSMICYGPLNVMGSEEEPVRIIPQEPGAAWGSFAVVRAGQPSHVRHLEVEGGSEAHINGLFLSGQLCFYWSDVQLEHCTVRGARADDGLNIRQATFSIDHCLFRDNSFDAFDGDWVRGTVQSSVFNNNGGDGIDLSWSRVLVRDCLLSGMADKAISVGEKSELLAFNNVIQNSAMGLASKDLSNVSLYACVFCRNQIAVALYRKKQIFGGATGRAVGCLFWDNRKTITADAESSFEVLAVGVDHWQTNERVTARNLLRGDPAQYYTCDEKGNILHNPRDVRTSPFRITAHTGQPTFGELSVPDLNGSPAGLWQPLALDAHKLEYLRGGK